MNIERIRLKNYRIYEELDLDIGGKDLVIFGENGRGKSTIFESIYFALFNEQIKGNKINLLRKGQLDFFAEVQFTFKGMKYTVKRSGKLQVRKSENVIKSNALLTIHNSENEQIEGTADVTSYIKSLLGMDGKIFINLIFQSQNNITRLMSGSSAERINLFDKFTIGSYDFENKLSLVKNVNQSIVVGNKIEVWEERIQDLNDSIASLNNNITTRMQDIVVKNKEILKLSEEKESKEKLKEGKEAELVTIKNKINETYELHAEISRLDSLLKNKKEVALKVPKLKEECQTYIDKLSFTKTQINSSEEKLEAYKKDISRRITNTKLYVQDRLLELKEKYISLKQSKLELEAKRKSLTEAEKELALLQSQHSTTNSIKIQIDEKKALIPQLEADIKNLHTQCNNIISAPGIKISIDGSIKDVHKFEKCPLCLSENKNDLLEHFELLKNESSIRDEITRKEYELLTLKKEIKFLFDQQQVSSPEDFEELQKNQLMKIEKTRENIVLYKQEIEKLKFIDDEIEDIKNEKYKVTSIKDKLTQFNYPEGEPYIAEIFKGFWTRGDVESQSDKVFLFGDNTQDRLAANYAPSATQALIRGLPNTIGIDTKKDRNNGFMSDSDFDQFKEHVDTQLFTACNCGKIIVIPEDGIGTGAAMLSEKAPKLFNYLSNELQKIKEGKCNMINIIEKDHNKIQNLNQAIIKMTHDIEIGESQLKHIQNELESTKNIENEIDTLNATLNTAKLDYMSKSQKADDEFNKVNDALTSLITDINVYDEKIKSENKQIDLINSIIDSSKRDVKRFDDEIKNLEQKVKDAKVDVKLKEILGEVQEILNRKNLPTLIRKKYIAAINNQMQKLHSIFGFDFEPKLDENIDSDVWNDLSGAQEVTFSLSLLFTIKQLLVPHINLFMVDEPTSNLDGKRVIIMKNFLNNISSQLDTQVIVTTHHSAIKEIDNCKLHCVS